MGQFIQTASIVLTLFLIVFFIWDNHAEGLKTAILKTLAIGLSFVGLGLIIFAGSLWGVAMWLVVLVIVLYLDPL